MRITKREQEIIDLLSQELTTKEIASHLYISYETVNTHKKNAMLKLEARNTAGLIRKAIEARVIQIAIV